MKARYAWIKPISPFPVSEKSISVRKLPAPHRITASFFFLDIENLTEVYERTSSVASVSLSKGTGHLHCLSIAKDDEIKRPIISRPKWIKHKY